MITDKKIEQLKKRKATPVIHEEFLQVIERLEFERDRATEEERLKNAYKKEKQENDDRFMGERDEARDQLRIERECRLANEAELMRADSTIGELRAEVERLRAQMEGRGPTGLRRDPS